MTAIAAHGIDASIRVLGAEPEGARDAHDSLASGTRVTGRPVDTISDGLRAELGTLTFPILRAHVDDILLVDDAELGRRRAQWTPREQNLNYGVTGKYAKLVGSAANGAVCF